MKKIFKEAFADMLASAKAQHEVDKANFAAAKAESRARHEEAKAMGRRDTRLVLEAERREAEINAANARREAAENRCKEIKKQ